MKPQRIAGFISLAQRLLRVLLLDSAAEVSLEGTCQPDQLENVDSCWFASSHYDSLRSASERERFLAVREKINVEQRPVVWFFGLTFTIDLPVEIGMPLTSVA